MRIWYICFFLSVCFMGAAVLWPLYRIHRGIQGKVQSLHLFFGGIFLAAAIMFFPIYHATFLSEHLTLFKTVLLSLHNAIRLFVIDSDFEIILGVEDLIPSALFSPYKTLAAVLYVLAPIATFGFVLSFIRSAMNAIAFLRHRGYAVYTFSELNERSILLAGSIHERDSRGLLLFTDVYDDEGERLSELKDQAKALGAICDSRDILLHRHVFAHPKDSYVFLIGEDEQENIVQAISIMKKYAGNEKLHLYVFAPSPESELLLNGVDHQKMIVRRIDTIRSLIQDNLYLQGHRLFDDAVLAKDSDAGTKKQIVAYVIGMGRYGTEMVKALTWFCQMDGYTIEIHGFDQGSDAASRFERACPELMDPKLNGKNIPGEASYHIVIHDHCDLATTSFTKLIDTLQPPTYVFVSLGSDEKNIRSAVALRGLFASRGANPFIQSVVFNSDECAVLAGASNYRGEAYEIDFIGDNARTYSSTVIMATELEQEALARHCKWGKEEDFWRYEYNYKSSVASAIHKKMKLHCHIPGAELPPQERQEQDRINLRILEHRRWNAYMRAEGYRYGEKRNDLAKVHPCLVPFDELSEKEKQKDDD